MFSSISLFASTTLLLSTTIFASPISSHYERDASPVNWGSTPSGGLTEVQKLNYVLMLESAHNALYSQAVANYSDYDFVNAGLRDLYTSAGSIATLTAANLKTIDTAISTAGEAVPGECTFDWGSIEGAFGWALFAEQFEGLLVSTYKHLLTTLTSASDISFIQSFLTESTANSALLRTGTGLAPTANYSPLTLGESGTLFRPIVAHCPRANPAIDISTHPTISISANALSPLKYGEYVTLTPTGAEPTDDITGAVLPYLGGGATLDFAVHPDGKGGWTGQVPAGVQPGLNYVVLSSATLGAGEAGLIAGPAVMEVAA